MSTVMQEVLADDKMIVELLNKGTIGGYDSLEQMYKRGYAGDVRLVGYDLAGSEKTVRDRLSALGELALSYGKTFDQFQSDLHRALVKQLKAKLKARKAAGGLGEDLPSLYDEIVTSEF